MTPAARENLVLLSILQDVARFAPGAPRGNYHGSTPYSWRAGAAREGAAIVVLSEWLGRPITHADSCAFSRTILKLSSAGLVKMFGDQRTKELALTPAGEQRARQLQETRA